MADKLDKQIEKAIDDVLKDYRNNMVDAVEYAFNQAVKDIWGYSIKTVLDEYYDEYDPYSYARTDSLNRAILPYYERNRNKQDKKSVTIKGTVGVQYDPSMLEKLYTTNNPHRIEAGYNTSWENGGQVEEEWILNNYLEGIHPDGGWKGAGYKAPSNEKPTSKMQSYLKQYVNTFDSNVLIYLVSRVGEKI